MGTYCADIPVEHIVPVEIKAFERPDPEHEVQRVNYLKATETEAGLLLNFGPRPQHIRIVMAQEYLKKNKEGFQRE